MTNRDPEDPLNPTLLDGEGTNGVVHPKTITRAPPDVEQADVLFRTGWPCRWDAGARVLIARHPTRPWLRVEGRTVPEVVSRVLSLTLE